jgi:hypothetical protein
MSFVQARRTAIHPNSGFQRQLREYELALAVPPQSTLHSLSDEVCRGIWGFFSTTEILHLMSCLSKRTALQLHTSLDSFDVDFSGRHGGVLRSSLGRALQAGKESAKVAAQLVICSVSRFTSLRRLCIRNVEWTDEQMNLLMNRGLEQNLQSLALYNAAIFKPPPLKASALQSLSLSRCRDLLKVDLTACTMLTALDLSNTPLSDQALEDAVRPVRIRLRRLVVAMAKNVTMASAELKQPWPALEELDITRSLCTEATLEELLRSSMPRITRLIAAEQTGQRISSGWVSEQNKRLAFTAPTICSDSLERLDMSRCNLLQSVIVESTSLTELDITKTALTWYGLLTIFTSANGLQVLRAAEAAQLDDAMQDMGAEEVYAHASSSIRQAFEAQKRRKEAAVLLLTEGKGDVAQEQEQEEVDTEIEHTRPLLGSLTLLDLSNSSIHSVGISILVATELAPQLETLVLQSSLSSVEQLDGLGNSSVTVLDLSHNPLSDQQLSDVCMRCASITDLDLSSTVVTGLASAGIIPTLRRLRLRAAQQLRDDGVASILRSCPALEELCLHRCNHLISICIGPDSCPRLVRLDISNCKKLSTVTVDEGSESCSSSLEWVDISGSALKSIMQSAVGGVAGSNEAGGVVAARRCLPRLRTIIARFIPEATIASLSALCTENAVVRIVRAADEDDEATRVVAGIMSQDKPVKRKNELGVQQQRERFLTGGGSDEMAREMAREMGGAVGSTGGTDTAMAAPDEVVVSAEERRQSAVAALGTKIERMEEELRGLESSADDDGSIKRQVVGLRRQIINTQSRLYSLEARGPKQTHKAKKTTPRTAQKSRVSSFGSSFGRGRGRGRGMGSASGAATGCTSKPACEGST